MKLLLALITIVLLLISCQDSPTLWDTQNISQDEITINAYFSQTSGNYKEGGGIDDLLIADILRAKESIHIAIYALTNDRIRDALVKAHQKGVEVKIVTDEKELFSDDMKYLRDHGIFIISDEDTHALMHNKFMIIDHKVVWTGSCNYTYYAFYRNNENLVKITSAEIANFYEQEFNELVNHHLYEGALIRKSIEVYFSPEDDFEQRLLTLIQNAKTSIHFLAFAFTNQTIADLLVTKYQEGVEIKGVMDEKQNSYQKSSQYKFLKEAGIEVKLDGNKATLHDKVFIIDHKTVVTGSYNFTNQANDKNAENVIVVHNSDFAARFEEEFNKIFALGK